MITIAYIYLSNFYVALPANVNDFSNNVNHNNLEFLLPYVGSNDSIYSECFDNFIIKFKKCLFGSDYLYFNNFSIHISIIYSNNDGSLNNIQSNKSPIELKSYISRFSKCYLSFSIKTYNIFGDELVIYGQNIFIKFGNTNP